MHPFFTYDVFTDRTFAGNPLAIVEEADALTEGQMQTLAREFNLSETIFVQTPDDPAHTAKVRIFFPAGEIPFAGHPTIGCAIHLATKVHPDGDFEALITLEEQAGLVPVIVARRGGAVRAEFTAPKIPVRLPVAPDPDLAAAALDLRRGDLGGDAPAVLEGGPTFLYICVSDHEALARARPVEPHWTALTAAAGCDNAYLYTADGPGAFRARMFAPAAGIPEDPATGSATAILAGQLLAGGHLSEGTNDLRLAQGVEMGRPSDLHLGVDVTEGAITAIRIAGAAVAVSRGHVTAPA